MSVEREGCIVRYLPNAALVTVSVRLGYDQELDVIEQALPSPPDAPEFANLRAAIERYVARIQGLDMSSSGRCLCVRSSVRYPVRQPLALDTLESRSRTFPIA
jgi:hypothetical protein